MSDRSKNWEIYRIATDGSEKTPTPLTNRSAADVLPAWSPDGHWIAFVSNQGSKWGVWIVSADGGTPQHLFNMEGSPHGFVVNGPPGQTGWLQEQISWFE
ncbi:MAG: hypothetical protein D6784_12120 [Chloroflexi bacterium]|nr:MAG: hypothetical protein D6784_12120 [Chloroflexota bacterium]